MTINYLDNITCTNTSGRIGYPRFQEAESKEIVSNVPNVSQSHLFIGQLGELFQEFFIISSTSSGAVNTLCRWGTGEVIFSGLKNTLCVSQNHQLSKYVGAWKGDDIDEMLDIVYKTRSKF